MRLLKPWQRQGLRIEFRAEFGRSLREKSGGGVTGEIVAAPKFRIVGGGLEPKRVTDKSGRYVIVPELLFKLGLSLIAERAYGRLKLQAWQDLPKDDRSLSKRIGLSRSGWNRAKQELRRMGLVIFTADTIYLPDLLGYNAQYANGKMSIAKIKGLLLKEIHSSGNPVENLKLWPESGPNLVPKVGQNGSRTSKSCINTKNNINHVVNLEPKAPTKRVKNEKRDDGKKHDGSQLSKRVMGWFRELSNGNTWRWVRDRAAFDEIKSYPDWAVLFGMAKSIQKCPEHRLGSFAYCVGAIREYAESDMRQMDEHMAMRLAITEYRKAKACIKLGKFTVPEMTDEELKSVLRESRAGD